jgi:hypothetical protein
VSRNADSVSQWLPALPQSGSCGLPSVDCRRARPLVAGICNDRCASVGMRYVGCFGVRCGEQVRGLPQSSSIKVVHFAPDGHRDSVTLRNVDCRRCHAGALRHSRTSPRGLHLLPRLCEPDGIRCPTVASDAESAARRNCLCLQHSGVGIDTSRCCRHKSCDGDREWGHDRSLPTSRTGTPKVSIPVQRPPPSI